MTIPAQALNIMFLGDPGTGCSSTILQAAHQIYTGKFISTIGVDYKDVEVDAPGGKKGLPLRLYDAMNGERFKTISYHAPIPPLANIIAFDKTDRRSFERIQHWLEFCGDVPSDGNGFRAPIILMRTKEDEEPAAVSDEEINKLIEKHNAGRQDGRIVGWCKTSAKNGMSMAPLEMALERIPAAQTALTNVAPEEWAHHKAINRCKESRRRLEIVQETVWGADASAQSSPGSGQEAPMLIEARQRLPVEQERYARDMRELQQLEQQLPPAQRQKQQQLREQQQRADQQRQERFQSRPASVQQPSASSTASVQQPSASSTASVRQPSASSTASVQQPSASSTASVRQPSASSTASVRQPSASSTASVQQPSASSTASVRQPSASSTASVQQPSASSTVSAPQSSTSSTASVQRPSASSTASVQWPSARSIPPVMQRALRQEMENLRGRDSNTQASDLTKRIRDQDELRGRLTTYITRVEKANENKDSFLHKFWIDSKQRHFSRDVNLEFAKLLRAELGTTLGEECTKKINLDDLREQAWEKVKNDKGWDGVEHRSARNSSELDGILERLEEVSTQDDLEIYSSPQLTKR